MVLITLLFDACILPIVTSATPSAVLIDHPAVLISPTTVGVSLTSAAFLLAQVVVPVWFVPSFIVETDVLGESIAHIFVLLITTRLPTIMTRISLVVACAVAALIDAYRTLLPWLIFRFVRLLALVRALALRRRRWTTAVLNSLNGWDRNHRIWIFKLPMLLMSPIFAIILFLDLVVDIVVNLRDLELVKVALHFKTKSYQFALVLRVAFEVIRGSTFDTPFVFA